MSDPYLSVRGLVKEFPAGGRRPTLYRALRSWLGAAPHRGWTLRALDGIDLDVRGGEMVGLVGDNGAGKTTLLKTVAGLYRPTGGRVEVRGEVALLAGLGVGMIDELSVTENIYLYGAVCGIPRRTITERFADIVAWAELDQFVEAELRTLSRGMQTRLAFAIAMHIGSDLLLMDEAFSTGDARFQDKCDAFFRGARMSGRTALVATHNLEFVREFCGRTVWLHKGRQMAFGATAPVLAEYAEATARVGAIERAPASDAHAVRRRTGG
jgi:ABC-type polysaccharide/polyol phosphate transport system ATPase subunit